MRLLISLTYYRPYTSGLTIYVERLATGLARRGHSVTVLTSQYAPDLPNEEMIERVRVVRVPILAQVNKGVLMPKLGVIASKLMREHDAINLHLPQFDTPGLALRARLRGIPVVLTYHCDVKLAPSLFNFAANTAVNAANNLGALLATSIVTYTQDYADHSAYLRRHRSKLRIITPPVDIPEADPEDVKSFSRKQGISGPIIGIAARLAAEKGVEVLLDALPVVMQQLPGVRILFAGPHRDVLGEQAYADRLGPLIARYGDRWTFVGTLSQRELAAFYANCSVIVVPSLNSTEAFGLVQVEAMLSGTPSIASNLPGVRRPVIETGMGEVVPVGDSKALGQAIIRVIGNRGAYLKPRSEIAARYNNEKTVREYETLLNELSMR